MNLEGKRCLIAYFSHAGMNYVSGHIVELTEGNTERVAQMVHLFTNADMFHIRTKKVYPFDYQATVDLARKENAANARPALEQDIDVSDYDVIFLGYPNWCGTMPMAVWTFLENHDFSGKTIHPFCTHEGSGIGRSLQDIRALCPDAVLGSNLVLLGTTVADAADDVRRWLRN